MIVSAHVFEACLICPTKLMLDVPARGTSITFTIETRDRRHAESILDGLARDGLNPHRLASGRQDPLVD